MHVVCNFVRENCFCFALSCQFIFCNDLHLVLIWSIFCRLDYRIIIYQVVLSLKTAIRLNGSRFEVPLKVGSAVSFLAVRSLRDRFDAKTF